MIDKSFYTPAPITPDQQQRALDVLHTAAPLILVLGIGLIFAVWVYLAWRRVKSKAPISILRGSVPLMLLAAALGIPWLQTFPQISPVIDLLLGLALGLTIALILITAVFGFLFMKFAALVSIWVLGYRLINTVLDRRDAARAKRHTSDPSPPTEEKSPS